MQSVASDMDEIEVRGMMATALRMLRLFGLAPLRFTCVESGVYHISISLSILIIGILCLFGIQNNDISDYFGWYEYFWITWSALFSSVAVIGGLSRMRRLKILLKQIKEIQSKIAYDSSLEPKVSTVVLIFFGTLFINFAVDVIGIYNSFLNNLYKNTLKPLIIFYAVYIIESDFVVLLEFQYIFLGFYLYLIVKTITYQMSQIIVNSKDSVTTSDNLTKKMHIMYQSYLEICKIINQINQFEGLMMMLLLIREVTDMFIAIYYIISTVAMSASVRTKLLEILSFSIMVIPTCIRTVCFVEIGYRLQCETNETKNLFTEMMWRQSSNVTLQRKLYNYMYQFLLHQPALSPLGIVTFSRPLIATIVGAAITFVIIILQLNLGTI